MKNILLIIIFLLNWSFVWGQIVEKPEQIIIEGKDTTDDIEMRATLCVIPDSALYEGGNYTFYKDLKRNLKYPRRVKKVKGEVYLIFTVSKQGEIISPKIEKSLGQGYDKMILMTLENINQNWAPARDNRGKPYNQEKRIQIIFKKRKFKIT